MDAFGVISKTKVVLPSGLKIKLKTLKGERGIKAVTKVPAMPATGKKKKIKPKMIQQLTRQLRLKEIPTKRKHFPKSERPPKMEWKALKPAFKAAKKGKSITIRENPPTKAGKRQIGSLSLADTGEVNMIRTHEKFQRKGVGTAMLEEAQRRGMNPRTSTNRLKPGEKLAQSIARNKGIDVGERGGRAPWRDYDGTPDPSIHNQLDIVRPNPFLTGRQR